MLASRPSVPSPALFTSPYIGPNCLRSSRTNVGITATSLRSRGRNTKEPRPCCARLAALAASSSLSRRATATTRNPSRASRSAIARPIPRLAPVTITLSMPRELAALRHRKVGDESQSRGNHISGETRTARGKDLALRRRIRQASVAENDIGKDESAGDWTCPREYTTSTYDRMWRSAPSPLLPGEPWRRPH